MGNKVVCFNCRKAFSLGTDLTIPKPYFCPECKGEAFIYPHRFRPPSKNDLDKWAVVKFLWKNGFKYQHIDIFVETVYNDGQQAQNIYNSIKYPLTMREAKEFVKLYSDFRIIE